MGNFLSARAGCRMLAAMALGLALSAKTVTGGDGQPVDYLVLAERSDATRILSQAGFGIAEYSWLSGMDRPLLRVTPPTSLDKKSIPRELRRALPGALIAANRPVSMASVSGLPWQGAGLAVENVSPPRVGSQVCGDGVRLGMIDTRVDPGHETLRSQNIIRRSFLDEDAVPAPADHGTAIASLLVGDPRESLGGLLPGATLYVAEVFKRREDGSLAAELYGVLQALDWLIDARVSVVNMSFETGENPVLSLILSKAVNEGLVLVAAAGNGGPDAAPAYPAAHAQVLAVTAVDRQAHAYRYANHGDYIDFSALGVGVRTASADGFQVQSGTSFAVPAITAAVAELIRRGLAPDPVLIRETLREVVQDVGAPGRDDVFGWGVLNVDVCAPSVVE
ncbi:MAG: S8 family serine peptidase [Alphaproteobacteria bacterium]